MAEEAFAALEVGDPAPWFRQRSIGNPAYTFDTVAGRYVVLCFLGTASDQAGQAANRMLRDNLALFDDERCCCFAVSVDPEDERASRLSEHLPGQRVFWDFDGAIGRRYGAVPIHAPEGGPYSIRRFWVVLDPTLRVMALFPIGGQRADGTNLFDYLRALPTPELFAGFEIPAPILILPNVFEPDLCRSLIAKYEQAGGEESGIMKEIDGKTVPVQDHRTKRRRDHILEDKALISAIQKRILRRVTPEIEKIFHFKATRMERYIVGCYAAEDGAHFRPHRDNTTRGTAHRRFAVSINLNADFEGGTVSFPEYGRRGYKAPPGGAVIFPCALLHAVAKVTQGRRYAFLPFLYDDAAARIREANNAFLQDGTYKASPGAAA